MPRFRTPSNQKLKSYLVTGGAGFIGSNIVEELLKQGKSVRILDNFLTGRKENISDFLGDVELIEGDIRDPEICRKAVHKVEAVLHQAALPSVPRSVKDPKLSMEINILGTLNMLIAARDSSVRKFIFASSSSIYGDSPSLPKKEGEEGTPMSPYAISKLAGENLCQVFARLYGLPTASLRYFNVFGPRQDPHSPYAAVIPNFITKMIKNESPTIYGDGEQSRDFTYVTNVVAANISAAESEAVSGHVMNIACADRATVNELVRKINLFLGKAIKPIYEDPRPGDVKHSFADISFARDLIDYNPGIGFDEGLKKTVLSNPQFKS